MPRRLALVAGEASGDLIAAESLAHLRGQGLSLEGIGGPQLEALGMDCWEQSDALAVRGYLEALSRLPSILAIRHRLLRRLLSDPPAVFLGVDAPDFNLGVEARLRQIGVTTVHLVSPTIWAWRPERIKAIAQAVDHMLCLFPFEPDWYRGTRVHAEFVGHPLADKIEFDQDPLAAKRALGIPTQRPLLAVMPGSRQSEIRWVAPSFLLAASEMARHFEVYIPAASASVAQAIRRLPAWGPAEQSGVRMLLPDARPGRPISHLLLEAADLVLVASGTATLEAALAGRPMVIGYRVPRSTHWLMRRRAQVRHVGLPNLLLKRDLVPECLQDACTPVQLLDALRGVYESPERLRQMKSGFAQIHQALRQSAAARVGNRLSELITR